MKRGSGVGRQSKGGTIGLRGQFCDGLEERRKVLEIGSVCCISFQKIKRVVLDIVHHKTSCIMLSCSHALICVIMLVIRYPHVYNIDIVSLLFSLVFSSAPRNKLVPPYAG